jgi:hypothetical protein
MSLVLRAISANDALIEPETSRERNEDVMDNLDCSIYVLAGDHHAWVRLRWLGRSPV